MRGELLALFCAATAPSSGQRVAMLLREQLSGESATVRCGALPSYRALNASLEARSVAWRRINATAALPLQPLLAGEGGAIAGFPAEVEIVTLQHAEGGGALYLGRVRSGAPADAASNGAADGRGRDRVVRTQWSAAQSAELESLVDDARNFAATSSKFLRAMHQLEGDNTVSDEEDGAEIAVQSIAARMHALLAPLLAELGDFSSAHVVLLPDRVLSALPLEALDAFDRAASLARDLSLAVALTRVADVAAAGSGDGATAQSSAFGFIADPRLEDDVDADYAEDAETAGDEELDEAAMRAAAVRGGQQFIADVVAEVRQAEGGLGKAWQGVGGTGGADALPSKIVTANDVQRMMRSRAQSGVLLHGMGRFQVLLPPHALAGLDASGCWLVVLACRGVNDTAALRQSKLDSTMSGEVRRLQRSWETAALLSLSGVNTVVLNQWATSLSGNHRLVRHLFPQLSGGTPVGKAMHALRNTRKENALKGRIWMNSVVYGISGLKLS
jgi:hypothetical protein